jgi:hypothetical protein
MANDNVLNRLEQANINSQSISKYSSPVLEMLHANTSEVSQNRVATQNTLSISAKYYTQSLQLLSQLVSNSEKALNFMSQMAAPKGHEIVGAASSAGIKVNVDKYTQPSGFFSKLAKAGELQKNKEI